MVAFRYGHSNLRNQISRLDNTKQPIPEVYLRRYSHTSICSSIRF